MNIINLLFLCIIGICLVMCCYQGLMRSVFSLLAFFLACLLAFAFTPLLSGKLQSYELLRNAMVSYTEGGEMLAKEDAMLARTPISQISGEQLSEIIERADLPYPMDKLVAKNIASEAFLDKEIYELGDYITQTFTAVSINIFSFFVLFCFIFLAFLLIIAATDFAKPFPILRKFDMLASAGAALILSCFLMFVVSMFIPVIKGVMGNQIPFITKTIEESAPASFFYGNNFFLPFVSGT